MTRLFLFSIMVVSASCHKSPIAPGTADCIRKEIAGNLINSNWQIGSVDEYRFQNKTVYAFHPDGRIIADAPSIIRDSNCNTLCNVGGYGGPLTSMCNGENFFQAAIFIRNIWKK